MYILASAVISEHMVQEEEDNQVVDKDTVVVDRIVFADTTRMDSTDKVSTEEALTERFLVYCVDCKVRVDGKAHLIASVDYMVDDQRMDPTGMLEFYRCTTTRKSDCCLVDQC